ncbi:MAG: lipoyl(octanoyl) transferase LipB [Pseudomonadota bacterium]
MDILLRNLGIADYQTVWQAMRRFTDRRDAETVDEMWTLQHPAVYTLGLNGKMEHLLSPGTIPVIKTDRGGQVTYHGPGQLIVYPLIDLRRMNIGIRALVSALENATIETLKQYGLLACARPEAPGVYINEKKIASVGLRVRRGCSYHGLSVNVGMDLKPFGGINICGYPGLKVTQLSDLGGPSKPVEIAVPILDCLTRILGYERIINASATVE